MFDVQGLSQSLNASDYLHLKKQKYIIICKALFKLKKKPHLGCTAFLYAEICRDLQKRMKLKTAGDFYLGKYLGLVFL